MRSCIVFIMCIVFVLYLLSRSILATSIIISIGFILLLIYTFRKCWKEDVEFAGNKQKRVLFIIKYIVYFIVTILICLWIAKNSGGEPEEYDYVDYMMDKAR